MSSSESHNFIKQIHSDEVTFPLTKAVEDFIEGTTNLEVVSWAARTYEVSASVIARLLERFPQSEDDLTVTLSTHPNAPLNAMRGARMRDHTDTGLQSFATRQGLSLEDSHTLQLFEVLDSHRISERTLGDVWDEALVTTSQTGAL